MEKINIQARLTELPTIFAHYPQITGVILFGSYDTPFFTAESDLDFGVVYSQSVELFTELALEAEISQALGTDQVDLVNLNKAPLILKYNAVAKGRIIYEKDYERMSDFLEQVFAAYCDYEYDYRTLCADYDESLRESYRG